MRGPEHFLKHAASLALLLSLPLSLRLSAAPPASPPPPDPAEVVRQLLLAHQPWQNRSVDLEDPVAASRYFDDSLVALARKDRAEAGRDADLPCLDFDPILQAQDYDESGITEPRIKEVKRSRDRAYEVTFTGRSEAWKDWNVRAVYVVVQTRKGWRIHDIEFGRKGSLRETLACRKK